MSATANPFALLPEVPAHIVGSRGTFGEWAGLRLGQATALALLVALAPLMLLISWRLRRDGAPATFVHYRVGRGGRLFPCIKFRTMRPDAERVLDELLRATPALQAEWEREHKLADDPRITPMGRWLRRTSLDELPQLVNVLRGEMTLVGPRPITMVELRRYGPARWQYLSVKPGMTGLWQVSGRSRTSYERRVELDRAYVATRSAWLDCKILARTVVVVLTRDGAS